MDREIGPEVRRRRNVRRGVISVIMVGALAFFLAATVEWLRPSADRRDLTIVRVERGAVEATVEANGTVMPLFEQVVSSPVEARVTRIGRRAGERVAAGDELLTLDTAATRLEAARLTERAAQKESEAALVRLRIEETIASLSAQLEQKRLDAEILRYTAQQKAILRKSGLVAEQEARGAETAARKSDIEIRQLEQALTRARRSGEAQRRGAETDLSIARRERDESARQVDLAMLRAPRAGVLTWILAEEGATVRRGELVARIADLSAFRVVATVSDIHAARIGAGQRAHVKFEDGAVIDGTVASIDPRIENGIVRLHVDLDQPSAGRLRNNLRVDVSIVAGVRRGVLSARRGSLAQGDASHAFVIRGSNAVRVPVRFGLSGDDRIEITSGLREGDEVVISDTIAFRDVRQVRLK